MIGHIPVGARRKAKWLALTAILAAGSALLAQAIIENPAKPKAENAGRILKLTELWRITDESGEFYFQMPYDLQMVNARSTANPSGSSNSPKKRPSPS